MIRYLRLAIYFIAVTSYCQNPGNINAPSLWLNTSNFNDSTLVKVKDGTAINALHFNFNPVLNPLNITNTLYKNLLEERYSFFGVFKSDTEEELPVATLTKGRYKAYITNKAVVSGNEIPYKQVDSKKGILLSFVSANSSSGKKNNSIAIEGFYREDKEGKNQLMEVIYYKRILSPAERRRVETYLSLKYGLSIVGEADYLNSEGDTIWKYKLNKAFNTRVTGIGRDDMLNLYQKQSGNAEKDGLYIGLGIVDTTNAVNKHTLKDKTFMLWGDNNGTTVFKKDKEDRTIKVMKRTWKMQLGNISAQDSISTQLRISKAEMALLPNDKNEALWLAINDAALAKFDYTAARYIKQSHEDGLYVYFNNVSWDLGGDGTDTFTFIKGPDYFMEYDALADCSKGVPGTVNVKINGGAAPYTLSINGGHIKQTHTTQNDSYTLTGLEEGKYTLTVTDSKGNIQTASPAIDYLLDAGLSLAPVWYLDADGQVVVMAKVANGSGLAYEWGRQGSIVAQGTTFTAGEPGDYTLTVTTAGGCKKAFPFTVKPGSSGWAVYPNPVKGGEPFYAVFNLDKEAKVNIRVSSIEGKTYSTENLGTIKSHTYRSTLITSGVYLITATINGADETIKLIVE